MQFKKLVLATILILMPAQSMAFVEHAQAVAKKTLSFMNDHRYEMILGGLQVAAVGIFGLFMYRDFQKSRAEKAVWDKKCAEEANKEANKSDEEIIKLAEDFISEIEERLAPQLKELRAGSSEIKCNIATFDYVHNKIYEFGYWIDRLEKRSLAQYVEKIKTLKSELTQLINCLNVVVDKDFMDEFESLRARVNYQRSLTSSFMHSAFNNSSFNASSFRESSHPFIR